MKGGSYDTIRPNVALIRAEQDVEKVAHHTHPALAHRDVPFTKLCSRLLPGKHDDGTMPFNAAAALDGLFEHPAN